MSSTAASRPWYRHAMVWLVIAPPAGAVIAGIITLLLVLRNPDTVLSTAPVAAVKPHVASSIMPPTD